MLEEFFQKWRKLGYIILMITLFPPMLPLRGQGFSFSKESVFKYNQDFFFPIQKKDT